MDKHVDKEGLLSSFPSRFLSHFAGIMPWFPWVFPPHGIGRAFSNSTLFALC